MKLKSKSPDAGPAEKKPKVDRAESVRAAEWLPATDADAAAWAAASMELGALVCTADAPACDRCPVRDRCAWRAAAPATATTSTRAPTAPR